MTELAKDIRNLDHSLAAKRCRRRKMAKDDQVLAIPTLVRRLPEPVRKIISDLSNTERVLVGLDLIPKK